MLFSLPEIKIIDGISKISTNQNRALIIRKFFIFFDINQSESSFNGHGIFNKFKVNQSEFGFISHGFFDSFDIKQSSIPSQVILVIITNQTEVFTDLKVICRSEPKYVYGTSQSISFNEILKILTYTIDTKVMFFV